MIIWAAAYHAPHGEKIIARRLLRRSFRLSWLCGSWRFHRMRNHKRQPLLAYQMGKVGSRSVYRAVQPLRAYYSPYHVPTLDEAPINSALKAYRKKIRVRPVVPDHLMASMYLCCEVEAGGPRGLLTNEHLVDELVELFLEHHDHTEPLECCDVKPHDVLGVDVYATPLPHGRGWDVYETPRADVLFLSLEEIRTAIPEATSFFTRFDATLPVANAAAHKGHIELYDEFKKRLDLSDSYLNLMYESRFSRHFYSSPVCRAFYRYRSQP